jgi:hypothetical protein
MPSPTAAASGGCSCWPRIEAVPGLLPLILRRALAATAAAAAESTHDATGSSRDPRRQDEVATAAALRWLLHARRVSHAWARAADDGVLWQWLAQRTGATFSAEVAVRRRAILHGQQQRQGEWQSDHSWAEAWRHAHQLRQNWRTGCDPFARPRGGVSSAADPTTTRLAARRLPTRPRHQFELPDMGGLTSFDCDGGFQRICVGGFASRLVVARLGGDEDGIGSTAPRPSQVVLMRLDCHTDAVWDVRWHHSGRSILTASFDGTAQLHDVHTETTVLTLRGHTDRLMRIHCDVEQAGTASGLSPDVVTTASRDGTIKRWDLRRAGTCVATLADEAAQRCVYCVTAPPPGGQHTLVSGHDGTLAIWDLRTSGLVGSIAAHARMIMDIQVHSKLGCLATASRDDTTKLWSWPAEASCRPAAIECRAVLSGQVY